MRRHRTSFVTRSLPASMMLVCLFLPSVVQAQQGAFDLNGAPIDPFAASSGRVVVLVFLRRDCPICGRYAPAIEQMSNHYQHEVNFFLVYPDKTETPQAVRKYLQDYGYTLPALLDPEHALVKLGRVQITPEVAVFDRSRHLVYDGRIDNWYVDLYRSRPSPTTHELDDAIQAALSGKPVSKSEVRGVGCYLSDLE